MKPRRMRESKVESHLVKSVEKLGGMAEKFKSPGRRNVPDRIISWPADIQPSNAYPAVVEFVECKRPGEKPTPAQHRDHERRRAMGFRVIVVDSIEAVDAYIEGTV
jgi:hypothetical protein